MSGFDSPVLVVGAGHVGLSLALGLAHHGIRSTIVEREESTSERSGLPKDEGRLESAVAAATGRVQAVRSQPRE
jgi:2-polyprenyl-6-methoxyphenol hydroxylase-like FAD-dependent oxidoreductase